MEQLPKKQLTDTQIEILEERYSTILHAEPLLKNFDVEVRITRKTDKGAFPDKEVMLVGWQEIAHFLGLHEVYCIRQYSKRFKEEGIVFYKKLKRRPEEQVRRFVCTYPTLLMAWSVRESQRKSNRLREGLLQVLRYTV